MILETCFIFLYNKKQEYTVRMNQYKLEKKKGDGTFSEVFMAREIETNKSVAIKCIKDRYASLDQVMKNVEIEALKKLSPHDNVIKLIKVLYDEPTQKLALVFQLMEMNLYQCLKSKKSELTPRKIKFFMYQLIVAIAYIHKKGIFHRDIKPQNVLVSGDIIKLADFGSCKHIANQEPHTSYIATRWYRPPQCLMTDGYYSNKMDVWGFGCVLFQMITKYPLFPGKNELDQVHKIHSILGTPPQELLQQYQSKASHMEMQFPYKKGTGLQRLLPKQSKQLLDLLYKTLAYNPADRITAQEAMNHEYFSELHQMVQAKQINTFRKTTTLASLTINTVNDQNENQSPQKGNFKKKIHQKRQPSKLYNAQSNDSHSQTLPPIHHLRVDLKLNIYGNAALKTQKKASILKKKADVNNIAEYPIIIGKKN